MPPYRMITTRLFARHHPQLIKLGRIALTHHLPAHAPVRIARNTGGSERTATPSPIDLIQHRHHPGRLGWLGDGEQVVGVLPWLAKVQQQYFRLAVVEARAENVIERIDCRLG